MTVLEFLRFLKCFEDGPRKGVRIKISRDQIHILVIIFGYVDMDIFPERIVRFLEKENPERFGPKVMHDDDGNLCEVTSFEFDDDGSLDDERGFPINWREV